VEESVLLRRRAPFGNWLPAREAAGREALLVMSPSGTEIHFVGMSFLSISRIVVCRCVPELRCSGSLV